MTSVDAPVKSGAVDAKKAGCFLDGEKVSSRERNHDRLIVLHYLTSCDKCNRGGVFYQGFLW